MALEVRETFKLMSNPPNDIKGNRRSYRSIKRFGMAASEKNGT
jgi:hypothetical protein